MNTILILAAIYGTLVSGNFVNAPKVVNVDGYWRGTETVTENQANALGYKLLVDEPPSCASNEYAVAVGWTEDVRINRVYEKRVLPPTYRAWTPLTIMRGSKAHGFWASIKTILDANDAYDEFIASQYCAECDPKFLTIRSIIVSQIGEEQTVAFLDSLKVEKTGTQEELLEVAR